MNNIIELKHSIQTLLTVYNDARNNMNVMRAVNAIRDIVEFEADVRAIPLSFYEMTDEEFLGRIAK
jgi:hypothetical protein